MEWVLISVVLVFGALVGAGVTSILYERNLLRVNKREGSTFRISQLDVFELPPSMRPPAPKPADPPK
jgi:hypothetical protein